MGFNSAFKGLSLPVITFNTWKKQVFDTPKKKKSVIEQTKNQSINFHGKCEKTDSTQI